MTSRAAQEEGVQFGLADTGNSIPVGLVTGIAAAALAAGAALVWWMRRRRTTRG
ncbi:LPXTG cell wall anchor domain-containing protein [Streptomyces sp. NPDC102370]|uniref:LPXTG cell wall anchor domain-containing protein n=1 Tax=Streptomyces sp. NPDC102370 TaxID=3366163 RepID=UPI00382345B5